MSSCPNSQLENDIFRLEGNLRSLVDDLQKRQMLLHQPEDQFLVHQTSTRKVFPLRADVEEEEMTRELFNEIDTNRDGDISLDDLRESVARYKEQGKPLQLALATALEWLVKQRAASPQHISFEIFRDAVKDIPRVKAERVLFAQALGVHELVAGVLPKGTFFDGLQELRTLAQKSDPELASWVHDKLTILTEQLEALLFEGIRKLRVESNAYASALDQNSKFSMDSDALDASFAKLEQFYDGPEKLIGTPNPKAKEGIRREHCERKNADTQHRTPNYNLITSPKIEYFFVVDPHSLKLVDGVMGFPHTPREKSKWSEANRAAWRGEHGRDVEVLGVFTQHPTSLKAGLQEAEVIALRLYTGPMYIWYNAVLRGYPKEVFDTLEGNRYETTVFCIISGIIKLSKLTEVPEDRRLYRGLGGVVLPESFWTKTDGFRGGVERGLMSATADRRVAMQYSGRNGKRCTVFEILVGRVDIGAELTWVSQYPGEREVLFPPLSCLEVMGEPRVEDGVIIVPLRVNMCLKGHTLEQLVERRKELHMAMVINLKEELFIQAPVALGGSETAVADAAALLESVKQSFEQLGKKYLDTPGDDYNNDILYKTFTAEAIEAKSLALCKVRIFSELLKRSKTEMLQAIVKMPLEAFASRAVLLQLETGMVDFPWKDVVEKAASVNFGSWKPEDTEHDKLELASAELGKNFNMRKATWFGGSGQQLSLTLPEGFTIHELDWSGCPEVCESPAMAALLIKQCAGLETLDLSANDIAPEGATALAESLTALTALKSLDLGDNCIGDSGAAAIVNSLGSFRSHILSVLPAVIDTPDFYEYQPIVKGSLLTDHLEFEVDASNDAHVRLSLKDGGEFEVVIGGWNNKQSVLRASAQGPPISQPFCGVVLEAGKFQRFRLAWSGATLCLFKTNPNGAWQEMLSATLKDTFSVVGAAFSTGFGSSGKWRVLDP